MARIYKRNDVWYLDVRVKGRRIRKRVGRSKRIAELALKDAEVKIAKEEFGLAKHDLPIEQFVERFLEYSSTNHRVSTTKRYRAVTDHLRRYLKDHRPNIVFLSQISEEIVEGYKSNRRNSWVNPNGAVVKTDEDIKQYTRKGARARTVNLEIQGIKIMMNLAVRWGYLRENPIRGVKFLKEDDRKPLRFLTIEECKKLLDASPSNLRAVFFTFLSTGMRKSELENLRWGDVEFKRRALLIRRKPDWNPKSGERDIPISDELYRVLMVHRSKAKKDTDSDFVFKARNSGHSHNRLRRELIKIASRAGIEGLTKLHTLRHTFASQLVMSGVDLPTIKNLMGHSDIQTTMIYAHLSPDHLSDAVNKLSFTSDN